MKALSRGQGSEEGVILHNVAYLVGVGLDGFDFFPIYPVDSFNGEIIGHEPAAKEVEEGGFSGARGSKDGGEGLCGDDSCLSV